MHPGPPSEPGGTAGAEARPRYLYSISETAAAEAKPRCEYLISKPHGHSSRSPVRLLLHIKSHHFDISKFRFNTPVFNPIPCVGPKQLCALEGTS